MPLPFPGMDPYLEAPHIWVDIHNSLVSAIRDQIQPMLSPRYVAMLTPSVVYERVEIATPCMMVPDIGIVKRYGSFPTTQTAVAIAPTPLTGIVAMDVPARYHSVEIRTVGEEQFITVSEILSPVNKRPGADGADAYESKTDLAWIDEHLRSVGLR